MDSNESRGEQNDGQAKNSPDRALGGQIEAGMVLRAGLARAVDPAANSESALPIRDMWKDAIVEYVAEDLELERTKFKRMRAQDLDPALWPERFRRKVEGEFSNVFRHSTGEYIVRRHTGTIHYPSQVKEFLEERHPEVRPAFFIDGDDDYMYEVWLPEYRTLEDLLQEGILTLNDELRAHIRRAVGNSFGQGQGFSHNDLQARNIMVALDESNRIKDIKIIDFQFLKKKEGSLENAYPEGAELASIQIPTKDLTGIHPQWADFSGANFDEVILHNTYLMGTDFSNASMVKVEFSDACLENTNFQGADLSYADFSSAKFLSSGVAQLTGENPPTLCETKVPSYYAGDFENRGYIVERVQNENLCKVTSPTAGSPAEK